MEVNSVEGGVLTSLSESGQRFKWEEVKGKETKSSWIFRFESFPALPPGRFSRFVDFASLLRAPPPPAKRLTRGYPRERLNTLRFYIFFPAGVLHGMLWKSFLEVPGDSRDCKTRGGGGGEHKNDSNRRKEMKKQTVHSFLRFFLIQISGSSSSCAGLSNDMRNERKFI